MKRVFFLFGISLAVILLIFGVYGWFLNKQGRVLAGTASPDFPYLDYSMTELEAMYTQNPENNAPTIQSPEETHQKFLTALKKGDFNEAVSCCFREGDREGMKVFLNGVKDKGQLDLMMNDIKEIKKDYEDSWTAVYIFSGTSKGEKVAGHLEFIKTTNGIWYFKSL